MKTLIILPARGGSIGVPRKNLRSVAGKPLLAWALQAALAVPEADRVVVSTDDDEIAEVAKRYGAEVIIRPSELARATSSSESALLHVLEKMRSDEEYIPDVLVFLQCTSPLTLPEDILGCLNLIKEGYDSSLAVAPFHYYLWRNTGTGAVGVNHDFTVRLMRQQQEPQFLETGAVYAMRASGFLEHRHRFFGRIGFHLVPQERVLEVDESLDLDRADYLLRNRQKCDLATELPHPVEAVVFDFDGVFTDNFVYVDETGRESVRCNRSEGIGIGMLRDIGCRMLVLSSETNPVVEKRCRKLNLQCRSGCTNKLDFLHAWAQENSVRMDRLVYVGNDVNDVPCLLAAGCGVAPADALEEAVSAANVVTRSPGGRGVIRELADAILQRSKRRNHNEEKRSNRQ